MYIVNIYHTKEEEKNGVDIKKEEQINKQTNQNRRKTLFIFDG